MSRHTTPTTIATAAAGVLAVFALAACGDSGAAAPSGSRPAPQSCFGSGRVYESDLARGAAPCGETRVYESDVVQQYLDRRN